MSRNRGSTVCDCGLWDLVTGDGRVRVEDAGLLREVDYWSGYFSGREDGPGLGYGFRNDLAGERYFWRIRDASGAITHSSNAPVAGWTRELGWTYSVPEPGDRYRWKRIQCPLCHRQYAGWYVQQPASLEPPAYELYDTSFWFARNDEPCPEDLAGVREITPDVLVAAVEAYYRGPGGV